MNHVSTHKQEKSIEFRKMDRFKYTAQSRKSPAPNAWVEKLPVPIVKIYEIVSPSIEIVSEPRPYPARATAFYSWPSTTFVIVDVSTGNIYAITIG